MSPTSYHQFFQTATGHTPYGYQCRLACGPGADPDRPDTLRDGATCESRLINIPTGLGKTEAVTLAWLWNRVHLRSNQWPRRLVYCLPMRTLVEQTRKKVEGWLDLLWDGEPSTHPGRVGVHLLMGGEDAGEWDLHPEESAILIGTQDMLLSRTLNRGYAAGRARWPKDFALLNNDCLWVFDEVQLISTGFATSLQLQAWRERQDIRPTLSTSTWWMSATLEKSWLAASVDTAPQIEPLWKSVEAENQRVWNEDAKADSASAERLKELLKPGTKKFHLDFEAELKPDKPADYIKKVAKAVRARRLELPKEKTLVIVNTVQRACALAEELKTETPLLIHSRFRHLERKAWTEKLKAADLIIATQVVEAGVDISSRVLFTELCPWPSFVQRCGRAARNPGEAAGIYWLDVSKEPIPYSDDELLAAKEQFAKLKEDASLAGLRAHRESLTEDDVRRLLPYSPRFVPQLPDLLGLFDTTPDLTGADVDVSRFIRDGDEHDVSVFWRDCSTLAPGRKPTKTKAWQPEHAELCSVPIWNPESGFRVFVSKARGRIWRWDYRDGWCLLGKSDSERIFPGQVFLLEKNCGGYHAEKGWTGEADDQNFEVGPWKQSTSFPAATEEAEEDAPGTEDESESSDGASNSGDRGQWRTIRSHSVEVCHELNGFLSSLVPDSDADARTVLPLGGRLHDWGKVHPAFKAKVIEAALAKAVANKNVLDGFPAKAPDNCWRRDKPRRQPDSTLEKQRDLRRPGFRHELASALAILELLRAFHPEHPALAWPDGELRGAFGHNPVSTATLQPHPLADEIAALTPDQINLLLFVVAAHHGKVRLSLRSSPDDLRDDVPQPCPPEERQARGVREGDALESITLPGADFQSATSTTPALPLHLDVMELGLSLNYGPSWRERMGALLATHGPFRLAWFETLLRIADQRASKLAEAKLPTA